MFKMLKSKKGFTLLELVVVISIIAILALIAVPVAIPQIERSRFSRTQADLDSYIKGVEIFYIENTEFPDDVYALKGYVDKIKKDNPYGGDYSYFNDSNDVYLEITELPVNRSVGLLAKLRSNSAMVGGEYRYYFQGGVVGKNLGDLLNEGYIPLANLDDIKAMDGTNNHTFAIGTPYERSLNSGEFGLGSNYVLVDDIILDDSYIPHDNFTGNLVGIGHVIVGDGQELFKEIDGSLFDIVLEGVNTESLSKSPSQPNDPTPPDHSNGETLPPDNNNWLSSGYVVQIAGGWSHSLALTEDGNVYAWGNGSSCQLGLGDTTDRTTPTLVTALNSQKIVQIAGGLYHSFALTEDGNVYSWGRNMEGQLGLGDTTQRNTPTLVTGLNSQKVVQVAGGGYSHSLALTEDGNVYAWGVGSVGQLGLGDTTDRTTPTLVTSLNSQKIVQIAGGYYHSLALTEDGNVYAWGNGNHGRLGLGNTSNRLTPTLITGLNSQKIVQIAGGDSHSLALTEDGNVYSWGRNANGQLGLGDTTNRLTPTLVTSLNSQKIVQIAAGGWHSLALTEDGNVYAWGLNGSGRLGLGDTTQRTTPTLVTGLNSQKVVQVAGGSSHSLALTEDGNVYAWGFNGSGRLGLGNTLQRTTPTIIPYFQEKNQ